MKKIHIQKSKNHKIFYIAEYQLYFYLYSLRLLKSNIKGILVYPKERKREEILLNEKIIKEMDEIIEGILDISNLEKPPVAENKPFCKNCSFFELCMV